MTRWSKAVTVLMLMAIFAMPGCCTKSGNEPKNRSERPWGGGPDKGGSLPGNMNEGR